MTHPDDPGDEPLDPEIDRLLEAERARPELSGADPAAERLLARIITTVGPIAGGAGGAPPTTSGGGGPGPGGAAGSGAAGSGAAGSGAAGSGAAGASALAHPALVGLVSLVIGMAAGAVMHATLAAPEVRVVVREVVIDAADGGAPLVAVAETEVEEEAETEAEAEAEVEEEAETGTEAVAAAVESATVRDPGERAARRPDAGAPTSLARESALLARAQSALARGAPQLAIAALRQHEARHPEGQLREEREALWISALVAAGDRETALARAGRFRQRFPGSPLQPAIDAALRSP